MNMHDWLKKDLEDVCKEVSGLPKWFRLANTVSLSLSKEAQLKVTLKNGSTVEFLPKESADQLRGFTADV